jgi:hypothetical protein
MEFFNTNPLKMPFLFVIASLPKEAWQSRFQIPLGFGIGCESQCLCLLIFLRRKHFLDK